MIPEKQQPRSNTHKGCGPYGDDVGDQDLNFLKNRIDEPMQWIEVDFDSVLTHPFPLSVGRRRRATWDDGELAAVKRYEGLPLSVVCYVAWAQDEGAESCNCHKEFHDKSMYDVHVWLTAGPADIEANERPDRSAAVVAEVTPRLKPAHPQWTEATLRRLARAGTKVRMSGWLMLDQEHPEQLKPTATREATRGTLWELHPIMQIEVWADSGWVPLDQTEGAALPVERREAG